MLIQLIFEHTCCILARTCCQELCYQVIQLDSMVSRPIHFDFIFPDSTSKQTEKKNKHTCFCWLASFLFYINHTLVGTYLAPFWKKMNEINGMLDLLIIFRELRIQKKKRQSCGQQIFKKINKGRGCL